MADVKSTVCFVHRAGVSILVATSSHFGGVIRGFSFTLVSHFQVKLPSHLAFIS